MKKALFLIIVSVAAAALSHSAQVAKVYKYDEKTHEIIIASPQAAELFKMGDLLCVTKNGKVAVFRVSFPMMSTARCRPEKESTLAASLVSKDDPVFRYSAAPNETVKCYKNYDAEYLKKYKKVRFIDEFDPKKMKSPDLYFIVNYAIDGKIAKTTEMNKGRKSAVDYYLNDYIIKKEVLNPETGDMKTVSTYDYYESGNLLRSASIDLLKRNETVYEYYESGIIRHILEKDGKDRIIRDFDYDTAGKLIPKPQPSTTQLSAEPSVPR
jgi:antitoxin component YwqK of YwqJK toxin-antitoxin module